MFIAPEATNSQVQKKIQKIMWNWSYKNWSRKTWADKAYTLKSWARNIAESNLIFLLADFFYYSKKCLIKAEGNINYETKPSDVIQIVRPHKSFFFIYIFFEPDDSNLANSSRNIHNE